MKVAITGGTGFLGKYVADLLNEEGYQPVILSRKNSQLESDSYFEVRSTDYSEFSLLNILKDVNAVVHLAATRGNQSKISEFQENEELTQNLYEACLKLGITNIVYASTISVYSDELLLPWSEEQIPAPYLMYGVSKLCCEFIGNIYSSKHKLRVKNLRFAHLYGFNEKNNYMINLFFRKAYHSQELVLHTNGSARREFLYAKDAAKSILFALKKDKIAGTFNIGSGEALTNYEVAQLINTAFNNSGNLKVLDPNEKESINSSYMLSTKAKNELNFTIDYGLSDAAVEIFKLMKELDDVPIFY